MPLFQVLFVIMFIYLLIKKGWKAALLLWLTPIFFRDYLYNYWINI